MTVNYLEFHMDLTGRIQRVDKEILEYLIFRVVKHAPMKYHTNIKQTNSHFDLSYMSNDNIKDICLGEEININQLKRLYQFLELVLKDQWYDGDVNSTKEGEDD
jgi:hypothetical protein